LLTHPGVGPVTALATDVFLGEPGRFDDGKAVASYVGMIPSEYSSGGRQRLGGSGRVCFHLARRVEKRLRHPTPEARQHFLLVRW
jgi:transposase